MRYTPTPTPNDARQLRNWIADELRRIGQALDAPDELRVAVLGLEPDRPRDGMLVYANGSTWDPGSGAGFYGRESGAWVKL